jgi:hypothetical protein
MKETNRIFEELRTKLGLKEATPSVAPPRNGSGV